MIDWVTAVLPFSGNQCLRGGQLVSINQADEVEWRSAKSLPVVGSHDQRIHVMAHGDGRIKISGNPLKFLQGHNLFGSDNLRGLVLATMLKLCAVLNLPIDSADLNQWQGGADELLRVDIAYMYSLRSRKDVRAWLRAAEMQSKSRHGRPITRGGTVYWGKHSRRWAMKGYGKADEITSQKSHRLPDLPFRDKLLDYAEDKLRIELVLRAMQLADNPPLRTAAGWIPETPARVHAEYLGSIDMSNQFSLTEEALADLPPRLIAVYKLWKAGEDLRALYPKNTFYRYRRQLLSYGIDIALIQPNDFKNVVPLVHALRPQAVAAVPDWAIGTSLYFDPDALQVAK